MARWLYTILFYLLLPLVMLRLWLRGRKAPAYRQRWAERLGIFPKPDFDKTIWVHSVSVGETIAAAPMIKALQARYPDYQLVVTTMTPTGSERVRALFADQVFHVYAPYDIPVAINRFLNAINPAMLIVMETELWPNTVHCCAKRHIPLVLANGRLSEKSARGYQRFSGLTVPMVQALSAIAAQDTASAQRFRQLGADQQRLTVTGSIKLDISVDEQLHEQAAQLKAHWSQCGERKIFIAASTHQGEDEQLLSAFSAIKDHHSKPLLLLVPRHPERFDSVAALCVQQGYRVVRRSSGDEVTADVDVLLGDTMGELLLLYGCSDIAFIGGSLVATGGHNMLEPAAWGLPLLTGPSDFNFKQISDALVQAGALRQVATAEQLAAAVTQLLSEEALCGRMRCVALQYIEANRGALERLLVVIGAELEGSAP